MRLEPLAGLLYSIFLTLTNSSVFASFFGAFVVNFYSEIIARIVKTPSSMFYVPGIFPIVPGFTAYTTVIALVQGNFAEALHKGILTLSIGFAIAFGIMLSLLYLKFYIILN